LLVQTVQADQPPSNRLQPTDHQPIIERIINRFEPHQPLQHVDAALRWQTNQLPTVAFQSALFRCTPHGNSSIAAHRETHGQWAVMHWPGFLLQTPSVGTHCQTGAHHPGSSRQPPKPGSVALTSNRVNRLAAYARWPGTATTALCCCNTCLRWKTLTDAPSVQTTRLPWTT